MQISNANDAFVQELSAALATENQLLEAQQEMLEEASDLALRETLEQHIGETKGHIQNVQIAFEELGAEQQGGCATIEALVKEARDNMQGAQNEAATDLAIGTAVLKAEALETAMYSALVAAARQQGLSNKLVHALDQNFNEDQNARQMAENNMETLVAMASG